MKRIVFISLLFMVACKPSHKGKDEANGRKDELAGKMATYFSEPVDSVRKRLELTDSSKLRSLNLVQYYFVRKYSRHGDSAMFGTITLNTITGNSYIEAETKSGVSCWPDLDLKWMRKNNDGMNYYSENALAPRAERILNDLPVNTKKHLNRTILDSFFRSMRGAGKIELDTLNHCMYPRLINNRSEFDAIFDTVFIEHPYWIPGEDGSKLKMRRLFKRYVDSLFANGDEFYLYHFYSRPPGYPPDHFSLITINEEFKDTAVVNRFYQNHTNEPLLFRINSYSISQ